MKLAEQLAVTATEFRRQNQSQLVAHVLNEAAKVAQHGGYSIKVGCNSSLSNEDKIFLESEGFIVQNGSYKDGGKWVQLFWGSTKSPFPIN